MTKDIKTISGLAKFIGVSRSTAWRLIDRDVTFPKPAKIGKQLFWASSDVEAWINAQRSCK